MTLTPGMVVGALGVLAWAIVLGRRLILEHTVVPRSRLIAVDYLVLWMTVLMFIQAAALDGNVVITGVIARTLLAVVGWALVFSDPV